MKLSAVTIAAAILLSFAGAATAVAQDPPAAEQNTPPPRDPAEAAEYANARKVADPARRAEALETFVKRYPNSSLKVDALEWAVTAYEQNGNSTKVFDLAKHILEIEPQSVRALFAYVKRARALGDQSPEDARDMAMQGALAITAWQKPENMTEAEYARLREEMTPVFTSAVAYFAMIGRDLATARMYYQQSVLLNPMSLEDTYSLGLVQLELQPMDPAGFWYIARSIHLAKTAKSGDEGFIASFGRLKYAQFHGDTQGWDEIVKRAAGETTLPENFSVAPLSAPDEQQ